MRKNLLSWQASDYSDLHRDRVNLALHLATVPLFWAGLFTTFTSSIGLGAGLMLVALITQGIGHKREAVAPAPILSPLDLVSRFFIEQTITFPRWILRGRPISPSAKHRNPSS